MIGPALRSEHAASLIAAAIARCAAAKDGPGRWRAECELGAALGGRTVDFNTAQAARRVAEVISSFPQRSARADAGAAPRTSSYVRATRAAPAGYF